MTAAVGGSELTIGSLPDPVFAKIIALVSPQDQSRLRQVSRLFKTRVDDSLPALIAALPQMPKPLELPPLVWAYVCQMDKPPELYRSHLVSQLEKGSRAVAHLHRNQVMSQHLRPGGLKPLIAAILPQVAAPFLLGLPPSALARAQPSIPRLSISALGVASLFLSALHRRRENLANWKVADCILGLKLAKKLLRVRSERSPPSFAPKIMEGFFGGLCYLWGLTSGELQLGGVGAATATVGAALLSPNLTSSADVTTKRLKVIGLPAALDSYLETLFKMDPLAQRYHCTRTDRLLETPVLDVDGNYYNSDAAVETQGSGAGAALPIERRIPLLLKCRKLWLLRILREQLDADSSGQLSVMLQELEREVETDFEALNLRDEEAKAIRAADQFIDFKRGKADG